MGSENESFRDSNDSEEDVFEIRTHEPLLPTTQQIQEPPLRYSGLNILFGWKKSFKMDGPDGGWAWCVALVLCLITTIVHGVSRTSGFFFVSFISTFDVSRQEASMPLSLIPTVRNLLGPVVGILGQKYSAQTVTLAGGVISSISCIACYFVSNMDLITVFFGLFGGVGSSLTVTLLQLIIDQYFVVHRSTASGLAFSGGCLGSFILPALVDFLLRTFGLQGTLLILGGIFMNTIPAAMVLRKPAWIKDGNRPDGSKHQPPAIPPEGCTNRVVLLERDKEINEIIVRGRANQSERILDGSKGVEDNHEKHFEETFSWFVQRKSLVVRVLTSVIVHCTADRELIDSITSVSNEDRGGESDETNADSLTSSLTKMLDTIYSTAEEAVLDDEEVNVERHKTAYPEMNDLTSRELRTLDAKNHFCERMEELLSNSVLDSKVNELSKTDAGQHLNGEDLGNILLEVVAACSLCRRVMRDVRNERELKTFGEICTTKDCVDLVEPNRAKILRKDGLKEHLKTTLRLHRNPMFLLICLCRTVYFITITPFFTVMVDFGKDKGMTEEDAIYLIAVFSTGGLFGRLGLGWVTDKNFLSLSRFIFCAMIVKGASTLPLPLITSRYLLMLMVIITGVMEGSLDIRHRIIILKYMAVEERCIALGWINFLPGLIGFALPVYIGFCRDTMGSYDQMFYVTGAIEISVGLLWGFEKQLVKPEVDGKVGEETVLLREER